jgi:hypothetical protein
VPLALDRLGRTEDDGRGADPANDFKADQGLAGARRRDDERLAAVRPVALECLQGEFLISMPTPVERPVDEWAGGHGRNVDADPGPGRMYAHSPAEWYNELVQRTEVGGQANPLGLAESMEIRHFYGG